MFCAQVARDLVNTATRDAHHGEMYSSLHFRENMAAQFWTFGVLDPVVCIVEKLVCLTQAFCLAIFQQPPPTQSCRIFVKIS